MGVWRIGTNGPWQGGPQGRAQGCYRSTLGRGSGGARIPVACDVMHRVDEVGAVMDMQSSGQRAEESVLSWRSRG